YVCMYFFFSSRSRHTRSNRDWRSDVCSSDLVKVLARERLPDRRIDDDEVGVAPGRDHALLGVEPEDPRGVRGGHLGEALERHPEIGRASCRERVEIGVGAVTW